MATDLQDQCWFDRLLPRAVRPYTRLARWDRPVGFWLLFWPCTWGLMLSPGFTRASFDQQFTWLALFLIGSIAMRGAGCTINDLWDRKLDAQVERTRHRPLASGAVGVPGAIIFVLLQCLVGLAVLYSLPLRAQVLSLAYVPLVIIYPLMKRVTMWPQLFLALVFNAGTLIGWLATGSPLHWVTWLLYLTSIVWTLGYDTIYAHMDQRDDAIAGIKSTVMLLGDRAVDLVVVCWWGVFAGWIMLGLAAGFSFFSWVLFGFAIFFQTIRAMLWEPENDRMTLNYFRSQHWFAAMLALACWYAALNHMPITG